MYIPFVLVVGVSVVVVAAVDAVFVVEVAGMAFLRGGKCRVCVCACVTAYVAMHMHALTLGGQQIHMPVSEGHSSSSVQSGCCSDTEQKKVCN